MNLKTRLCLVGSAVALSLIGTAAVCRAQTSTTWVWTPYDYEASRIHAIQAINDAGLSKQDIASVLGLVRDLRDAERDVMMASVITSSDMMPRTAAKTTAPDEVQRSYAARRESIWKSIHQRLGDAKAYALHDLVEPRTVQTTAYYDNSARIRRMDEVFTWWDNRNSGQTVVATTTVTPDPTARAHREIVTSFTGVAPLTNRELADLLEAKLIAMTGSDDAAWILQGMYSDVASDDIKFAREHMMRVWDWF